jgi:SAM-dependent methyltransferase
MHTTHWTSYNELAWTEPILSPPDAVAEEAEAYCRIITEYTATPVRTLLHLGSGAGILDRVFKAGFRVTGVDISPGMLEVARRLNPEVTYHEADMRSLELYETFDAVAIPDSIGYMTTVEDLREALRTAAGHLKPGGTLLVVAHSRDEFRENNFAYSGSRGDTHITVFENDHIPDPASTTYEATLVYLIRRKGDLEIITDRHTIGIFGIDVWRRLLEELRLRVEEFRMDHLYDANLLGEGDYRMTVFLCHKME